MSLNRSTINWNSRQIYNMVRTGVIDFSAVVQRSFVWEKKRRSALIESIIIGYPVPAVFAKRQKENDPESNASVYFIMDGKQRLSTISSYLEDEFTLSDLPPVHYHNVETNTEEEFDISGKKFSELPDSIKDIINTFTINVEYFDDLTDEEEKELFKRLNAGKPLSAKNRTIASCKDIYRLIEVGEHELFKEMLTERARGNKSQVAIVVKFWCMLNRNISEVSFESRILNPLVENTEISEEEKNEIVRVLDYAHEVHEKLLERKLKKVAKKFYKETHLVSLVPYLNAGINSGIDVEKFADWVEEVFDSENGVTTLPAYNDATLSGVAKNSKIIERDNALSISYNEFFA